MPRHRASIVRAGRGTPSTHGQVDRNSVPRILVCGVLQLGEAVAPSSFGRDRFSLLGGEQCARRPRTLPEVAGGSATAAWPWAPRPRDCSPGGEGDAASREAGAEMVVSRTV
jgi:hypothetical protein